MHCWDNFKNTDLCVTFQAMQHVKRLSADNMQELIPVSCQQFCGISENKGV